MDTKFNQGVEDSLNALGATIITDDEIVKIKPHVGRGGFGKVYRGVYNNQDVAIKKIKLSGEEAEMIGGILNEIRIVMQCQHPRFPKFYGIWKSNNSYRLVFEFIKGPALKDIYSKMDKKEKLSVIEQLSDILNDIHQTKMIHRDIKPGNIMIEPGNVVRLIDFGISKIASQTVTFTGSQSGTTPYMSPEYFDVMIEESVQKPIHISSKVDIWATGCLISEIFSGHTPWSNKCKNEYAIIKQLTVGGAFPIPKNVDDEIKEIIKKCTEKEPNDRCSAADIKNDIMKIKESLV